MRPGPLVLLLAAAAALAACADSPDSPDEGGAVTISGDERLGWDQQAASAAELASLRYAIYVDGIRSEMTGVACENVPTVAGFPCSGELPSMSPGTHTLEVAAFVTNGNGLLESPRSPPFRVTLSPALTAPPDSRTEDPSGDAPSPRPPDSSFERVTAEASFQDIADAAMTSDGWLLVAEREGVLYAMDLEQRRAAPPVAIDGTRAAGMEGSLVAIAAGPDFARTGFIYVLQTAVARDDLTWQIARYRRAGDTFGERAVLRQFGSAPGIATGAIEIGPDGLLYVALEDARARRLTRRGTEQQGLVLRLNPDGSTPSDQIAGNPVYAAGPGEALGLDWQPETGALWTLHADARGTARLAMVAADRRRARAGLADREQPLSSALGASDMAFYRGRAMPALDGALLVASESGLLRVRFDPNDATRIASVEPMLDTPVRAVLTAPDGRLLIATPQAVYRLRPQ